MSTTEQAYQIAYIQKFVQGLEAGGASKLRETVFTEAIVKGNQAEFIVSGSDGDEASTRGVNGDINFVGLTSEQYACTLKEWHAPIRVTSFNIFASQGSKDDMMQNKVMKMMNRRIDKDIITALDGGTVYANTTATTASHNLIQKALGILGNAEVDLEDEDNIFGLITPSFRSYLNQIKEFTNALYVDVKPLANGSGTVGKTKFKRWAGVNWITSTLLPGKATAAEHCFIYHRNGIGHAMDSAATGTGTFVGFDEQHGWSYHRSEGYMGSKLLQGGNAIRILHDGSKTVAE